MLENLKRLGSRDPLAAALSSVVARSEGPSLPPSITRPDPAQERLARRKVRKCRGKEVAGNIKTWGEGWEIAYGEDDASIHTSEMFADWESRATTPSLKKMPEPVCEERAFPPRLLDTCYQHAASTHPSPSCSFHFCI